MNNKTEHASSICFKINESIFFIETDILKEISQGTRMSWAISDESKRFTILFTLNSTSKKIHIKPMIRHSIEYDISLDDLIKSSQFPNFQLPSTYEEVEQNKLGNRSSLLDIVIPDSTSQHNILIKEPVEKLSVQKKDAKEIELIRQKNEKIRIEFERKLAERQREWILQEPERKKSIIEREEYRKKKIKEQEEMQREIEEEKIRERRRKYLEKKLGVGYSIDELKKFEDAEKMERIEKERKRIAEEQRKFKEMADFHQYQRDLYR